jgi:hypothetical protein
MLTAQYDNNHIDLEHQYDGHNKVSSTFAALD